MAIRGWGLCFAENNLARAGNLKCLLKELEII
jgi:hypothetical protein